MKIQMNSDLVKTSFDVVCDKCEWTGVITLDQPNIAEIAVGGTIDFSTSDGPCPCPVCKTGSLHTKSGVYRRNKATNHMERVGDYTPKN